MRGWRELLRVLEEQVPGPGPSGAVRAPAHRRGVPAHAVAHVERGRRAVVALTAALAAAVLAFAASGGAVLLALVAAAVAWGARTLVARTAARPGPLAWSPYDRRHSGPGRTTARARARRWLRACGWRGWRRGRTPRVLVAHAPVAAAQVLAPHARGGRGQPPARPAP